MSDQAKDDSGAQRESLPTATNQPEQHAQTADHVRALDSGQPRFDGLPVEELRVARAEVFFGPLPHPDHLAAYNDIAPGAAERLIAMAENQAGHRQRQESLELSSNLKMEVRGQTFGFAIVMTALIGGIGLMAFEKPVEGAATALSALAAVTGLFVWSRHRKARTAKLSSGEPADAPPPPDPPPNSPSPDGE